MLRQHAADRRAADRGRHDRADEQREAARALRGAGVLEHEPLAGDEHHAVAQAAQAAPGDEGTEARGLRGARQPDHAQQRAAQQHAARARAVAPGGQGGLAERHHEHEEDDGQRRQEIGRQRRTRGRQRLCVAWQERARRFLGQHEQEQGQAQPRERGGAIRDARAAGHERMQQLAREEDRDDEHHAEIERRLEQDVADPGVADLRLDDAHAAAVALDGHLHGGRAVVTAAGEQHLAGAIAQREPREFAVGAAHAVQVRGHAGQFVQRQAVVQGLADQLADRAAHHARLALQLRPQEFLEGPLSGPGDAQHAQHHCRQDRRDEPGLPPLGRGRRGAHRCGGSRRATSTMPAAARSVVAAQPAATISTRRSRMRASAAREDAAA